jgi:hypothetical protein
MDESIIHELFGMGTNALRQSGIEINMDVEKMIKQEEAPQDPEPQDKRIPYFKQKELLYKTVSDEFIKSQSQAFQRYQTAIMDLSNRNANFTKSLQSLAHTLHQYRHKAIPQGLEPFAHKLVYQKRRWPYRKRDFFL